MTGNLTIGHWEIRQMFMTRLNKVIGLLNMWSKKYFKVYIDFQIPIFRCKTDGMWFTVEIIFKDALRSYKFYIYNKIVKNVFCFQSLGV